ncbi:MAG: hypothetical protein PHZ19_11955, partial [Candidatus Thermoplasmatota archaeon]|nr:hypothetical protein [Candidatus Thermoplasmatota archaeon]
MEQNKRQSNPNPNNLQPNPALYRPDLFIPWQSTDTIYPFPGKLRSTPFRGNLLTTPDHLRAT